jgi:hypothetical protein
MGKIIGIAESLRSAARKLGEKMYSREVKGG